MLYSCILYNIVYIPTIIYKNNIRSSECTAYVAPDSAIPTYIIYQCVSRMGAIWVKFMGVLDYSVDYCVII